MSTAKAMTPDRLERLQALFSDSRWFKEDEGQELLDEIERAWGEIERLKQQVDDAENDAMHAQDELAARAPADASPEARAAANWTALRDTFTKLVHVDHMARHLCEKVWRSVDEAVAAVEEVRGCRR